MLLVLLVAAVLHLSPLRNCGASGASGEDPRETVVQPFSRCSCAPILRGKSGQDQTRAGQRIPEDRFDGAPLRYSRERAVVYSHRSV